MHVAKEISMKKIILCGLFLLTFSFSFAQTAKQPNLDKNVKRAVAQQEAPWVQAVRGMEYDEQWAQRVARCPVVLANHTFVHHNSGDKYPKVMKALRNHPIFYNYPIKISATVAEDSQDMQDVVNFLTASVYDKRYSHTELTVRPYGTDHLHVTLIRIVLPNSRVTIDIDPKLRTLKAFTPVLAKEKAIYVGAYASSPVDFLEYVY